MPLSVPRFAVALAVLLTTVSVYAGKSGHFLPPLTVSVQDSCGDDVPGPALPFSQGSLQDEEVFVQTSLYTNIHARLANDADEQGWSLANFWHACREGAVSSKAAAELHRLKGLTLHAVNATAAMGHGGVSWLQHRLGSRRMKSVAPLIAGVACAGFVIIVALSIFCFTRNMEPRETMEEQIVSSYLHQVSRGSKHTDKGDRSSLLGKQSLLPVHKRSLPESSLRQQAGQWQKDLLHDNVPPSAHAEPPSAVQHARESSREKYHPSSGGEVQQVQHPRDSNRDRNHPSSSEVTSARDSARSARDRDQHQPMGSGPLSEARLSDARLSREGPGLAQALMGVKSSPLPPAAHPGVGVQKPASSSPQLQRGSTPPGRAIVPPLCSSLVLPVCEGYFAVSVPELAELDETGGGSLDIVGLTGNRLLRATARGVPMKCALEIFMTHSGSAPRASIKPATGSQSSGTLPLEIRGTGGGLYGVLEARTASHYVVKAKHRDVMAICGASDSLDLSVNVGEQLVADTKCNSDNFGGVPHLEIRVEPGVDPILILSCILAVVLQSTPKDLLTKCSSP